MENYLSYKFVDDEQFISTFDEASLWSARFGFLLLDNIELKSNQTVIDIGSGAGFPLLELAGQLGSSSKLYGIDPWKNANGRAKQKIENYGLTNVEIIEQSAENIPFEANSVDLIVINLGINNFENPSKVFQECFRVLKPKGKLVVTTNLTGHWKEFYSIFESTLNQVGKSVYLNQLQEDEEHRGTLDSVSGLFTSNGLKITKCIQDSFSMKFLDGTAFLNHHLVQCGWLGSWFSLFPTEEISEIFMTLEQNLNIAAKEQGYLNLTVPMAFVEGEKI